MTDAAFDVVLRSPNRKMSINVPGAMVYRNCCDDGRPVVGIGDLKGTWFTGDVASARALAAALYVAAGDVPVPIPLPMMTTLQRVWIRARATVERRHQAGQAGYGYTRVQRIASWAQARWGKRANQLACISNAMRQFEDEVRS